jgi:hypothetical protein
MGSEDFQDLASPYPGTKILFVHIGYRDGDRLSRAGDRLEIGNQWNEQLADRAREPGRSTCEYARSEYSIHGS